MTPDDSAAVEIPHDVLNEQLVIASAMTDTPTRTRLLMKIQPENFVDPQHRALWAAIVKMDADGTAYSLPTLATIVVPGGVVDGNYVRNLVKQNPTPPASLDSHITQLQWDSARARAANGPLQELLKALRDSASSPALVRACAETVGKAFNIKLDRQFMSSARGLADAAMQEMQARKQMAVYPLGLPAVDMMPDGKTHRIMPGAAPGKTTLVTGVSGSGKSTITAMLALAQANAGRNVLYGPWEMGAKETILMMAAMDCGIPRRSITDGQLTAAESTQLHTAMERIGQYIKFFDRPFTGDFKTKFTTADAQDILAQQLYDSGCDVFVADLWERIMVDSNPADERTALQRQQQMAVDVGCHQILVCQQKLKEIESRRDKHPTRSTIFGSAAWVEIADTILGVHTPRQWDPHAEATMEISVLKQRYAVWPFNIEHDWDGNAMTLKHGRDIELEDPMASGAGDLFGGKK